jgi:predicted cupin superfamily sugar epimerase
MDRAASLRVQFTRECTTEFAFRSSSAIDPPGIVTTDGRPRDRSYVVVVSDGRRYLSLSHNHKQTADVTADAIRNLLKLEPNATCGFVRETYRSALSIAPGGFPAPFAGNQPLGSALYFMVTPAAPVKLHRLKNDQLYHYYLGDPIEVLMLHADGTHGLVTVGSDLRAGQMVQLFIPGNTFHTACIVGARRWFLGGSTEWPGVLPKDVELGDVEALAAKYPDVAAKMQHIATQ